MYNMDKENLLSEQINRVPSLRCPEYPSKEQEQMLETSSQVKHNPNNMLAITKVTKTYMAQTHPFQM